MADAIPLPSDGERWLPVIGYEGIYEVSDHGRVRRIAKARGATPGRVLSPFKSRKGYLYVELWRGNESHRSAIHHLVLEAFANPRPDGCEVNHKNGDKTHNYLSNLEWLTSQGNRNHAREAGLTARGERIRAAKLTAGQVIEIRRLEGATSADATAAQFGVSRSQVYRIWSGELWAHLLQPETDVP